MRRGRGGKERCFCCDVEALPEKVKTAKGRADAMRYLRALNQFEDKTPYNLFRARLETAGMPVDEERVRQPRRGRSSNFCVGWKQPQEGSEESIQQVCLFSTAVSGAKVRSRAV